ncbi:hypothetical protein PGT21_030662 [Puccinia graminis f. sp. tritici]|uniref:Uncharacterized protein n=1 Tax=Puccinia graminis f. sp. tritici TaxID=56615 RepID=A0A5B0QPB1_PUCGR|nr:hypothetical protein PGT21_030662 [Puccinia graminis f. sp. tritici]
MEKYVGAAKYKGVARKIRPVNQPMPQDLNPPLERPPLSRGEASSIINTRQKPGARCIDPAALGVKWPGHLRASYSSPTHSIYLNGSGSVSSSSCDKLSPQQLGFL